MGKIWGVGFVVLGLVACNSTPPATVDKVEVAGLSSNTLKIGEAAQFTAAAKTVGGTTISGKTFTWTSSDPNIASVDSSGKVTAKHLGTVTISASVDGKTGQSGAQTTYGLEITGGTRVSATDTKVQTAFLARYRKADGSRPATSTFSITGPAGWNSGAAYDPKFGAGCTGAIVTTWRSASNITPVSGTYQATAVVDGDTFTATFSIDASPTLPNPSLSITSASASSVSGAWAAVSGAGNYYLNIYNATDQTGLSQVNYGKELNATLSGLTLDKAKTYNLQLFALSADFTNICEPTYVLPAAFNVSFDFKPIALP